MKQVIYNHFGGVEQLTLIDTAPPLIHDNQVLIQVKAVSINPLDWKIRNGAMKLLSGSKFPKGIGIDFAGVVTERGKAVTKFKVGDEVFGAVNAMKEGALAECLVTGEESIVVKPANISFAQAAALPIVGSAALAVLEKVAPVAQGTALLLNGATGGIGMIATQLAKQKGAHVTAVCSTKGVPFAQKWGSDAVIDYTKQDVRQGGRQYDVVFDLAGRLPFAEARKILKPHGIFINPAPEPIQILTTLVSNLFTAQKNKVLMSSVTPASLQTLAAHATKGLDIEISKTYPMSAYQAAYSEAQKGGIIGKTVFVLE